MLECLIGIKDCGCVVCAMVDIDYDNKEEELNNWKKEGMKIERVSIEEARSRLTFCKHKNMEEKQDE
jgi:hypothetical protein